MEDAGESINYPPACYFLVDLGTFSIGGVDEKTFRKWYWYVLKELSCCEGDVVSLCHGCLIDLFLLLNLNCF